MPKAKTDRPQNRLGAAHLNPADAYRDVPILKRPDWNHEIAAYFYLGGISAGAAVIGSLADVFNVKRYRRLARTAHYVSFAALLPCPLLLIDDLGVPSRFHHMLRVFKPTSPMNLGAWAFAMHGIGATLTVGRMLAEEDKVPVIGLLFRILPERLLAGLGLPSSLVLAGYTGVLLGTTSVPIWQSSHLLGALFNASSFSAGTAAVRIANEVRGDSDDAQDALHTLALAAGGAELALLGGYIATSGKAAKPYREGETGVLMAGAIGSTLASGVLELISAGVHSKRKKRALDTLASMSALVGGGLLRWAVVRAGKVSASDRELTLETMKPRERVPGWGPEAHG